ncbi:MAG TPA: hypothetical protein PLK58_09290 [Candidatus Rifleibacterium sp.]|nr:hypothetical protein [Candidatus Rifleibacterium sp.]HPW58825.1 hypothetical protein [Candidatus Rifleibacterium sp.]
MTHERIAASFRDPCGFVFWRDGQVFRQVNPAGLEDYRHLMQSGLYEALTGSNLLIKHSEVAAENPDGESVADGGPAQVLRPEQVQFISYP